MVLMIFNFLFMQGSLLKVVLSYYSAFSILPLISFFFLTIYIYNETETPVTMCGGGTAVSVNIDKL